MSRTPTSPDEVTAPAPDAQLFRSSPTWAFLVILFLVMPVFAIIDLLLDLPEGADLGWRQVSETVGNSLLFALVAAGAAAWQIRRRRTWVRISSGGIELAADGGDPILIDWSEIICARIRRRGLWAVLDVVPTDPDTVRSTNPHRDLPRMRDTPDGTAFTVPAGGLRPRPAALRTALARHTTTVA